LPKGIFKCESLRWPSGVEHMKGIDSVEISLYIQH
jgi:hypothetical protein